MKVLQNLDFGSERNIANLPEASLDGQPLTYQQRVRIAANSSEYFDISNYELSAKSSLVKDVVIDTANTSVADHVANYPSIVWDEGDELVLTSNSVSSRVYRYQGGGVSAANFILIDDALDAALIRSYISVGDSLTYINGTINLNNSYDEVASLSANTPYLVNHGLAGVPIVAIYDSNGEAISVDVDIETGVQSQISITSIAEQSNVKIKVVV